MPKMAKTNRRQVHTFTDDEPELPDTQYSRHAVYANQPSAEGNHFQHNAVQDSSHHAQFSSDSLFDNPSDSSEHDYNLPAQVSPLFEAAHPIPRRIIQPESRWSQYSSFAPNIQARNTLPASSSPNGGVASSPRNIHGVSSSNNVSSKPIGTAAMTTVHAYNMGPQSSLSPSAQLAQPPITTSKAYAMKMQLGPSTNIPLVTSRKRIPPEHDPENYEIKRLRCDEKMSWTDIAQYMNDHRVATGKAPTFTEAAVYGRFVRNGPRIAKITGEEFSIKDHATVPKNRNSGLQEDIPAGGNFNPLHDEYLVEAYAEAQAAFWETVAEGLYNRSGKQYSMAECATRYNQL
jgi:hypothetical protein